MKTCIAKRWISIIISAAMILGFIPRISANAQFTTVANIQTDPGTADSWEHMLGTDADGNRYAGRVWVDKSVYKNGDIAKLNSRNDATDSFQVSLEADEAFQVIFSALGSTMTTKSTVSTSGPMDVVLILDNSVSMNTANRNAPTRMEQVINAANRLLNNLLTQNHNVRLGIASYAENASTILPFGKYDNGVVLKVNSYTGSGSSNGVITAYNNANQIIDRNYKSAGYANYTNIQAGFNLGMQMLANATDTEGRKPVVILLTDGAANTAVDTLFHANKTGTTRQIYYSDDIDPMIALSTLMDAAYNKASVEDHYGKSPVVYGIGVDLSATDGSNAIIDPQKNFNVNNVNANIQKAYREYTQNWLTGKDVTVTSGTGSSSWSGSSYTFHFGHEYPQGSAVTDSDIAANIHYVDSYYPVTSSDLQSVFDQIYEEISSNAFNPITTSTVVDGVTGVDNTPLIYVDFIGQYMEVKEIEAVTLFGASYSVSKNSNGNYTVAAATGINPTTGERWNTAEDITIALIPQEDGTQKLEIRINQEILPILVKQVESQSIGDVSTATITNIIHDPLRVYYTIGLDQDILLPNGDVDVRKIQGYPHIDNANGTVSFYTNQFGVMNPAENDLVMMGDSHVGFQPSPENRYYYHQSNQGIFTQITDKATGNAVTIPENEQYGVVWSEADYDLTWMSYEAYLAAEDTDKVYTYVTYYRPTPAAADAANAAEEVTYLVYTDWTYLKNSVAFYDATAEKYVNYHATDNFVVSEEGIAIPQDHVTATIAAYRQANPNAAIYAVLGVGSMRTSRLHNMATVKTENPSATAMFSYAPVFLHSEEAQQTHNDNDVVVWLGNSGKLTVSIDTGIALTKEVTEPIGSADDTYALTVTIPSGVSADPVVVDTAGNDVTGSISSYHNHVLTVHLQAGQTVYIRGIPGGTVCAIDELIPENADYVVVSKTDTVTVPTLEQVLNGMAQFAPATVTNSPNRYGDLTIVKDIRHHLTHPPAAMKDKIFTFKVQLPVALAGNTYAVDKANASLFPENTVQIGQDGSFTVQLKGNESITILSLPEGTAYTVTEESHVSGYENTTGTVSGTILAKSNVDAHFINTYSTTPIKPAITVTGTKTLQDTYNTYTGNESFQFVLSQYRDGAYHTLGTATANAGGSYRFDLASLLTEALDLGEHYFRVTEIAGITAGMIYDSANGLFAVKVTDADADGILEYAIENYANTHVNGNTVTMDFTNIYDVERTYVDIHITKTLTNETGIPIPLDLFRFQLVNEENAADCHLATTDASGNATIRIADLAEGTYRYRLTEVDSGMAAMTYDPTEHIVDITVSKNGAALVAIAEIQGAATNGDHTLSVSFHNTYHLAATAYAIGGTKTLIGRAPQDSEFTFALYEANSAFVIGDAPIATTTNVGTAFAFDQITYTKVGTYYYSVKEIAGNVPGVTYDTTHYHVTVTVAIDPQDPTKLAVTGIQVNKVGTNQDTSGSMVFVNTYTATPTSYQLAGHKILNGRAMQAGEFTFALYEGETLIETTTNKADGSFAFTAITYAQIGIHTYTIQELEPAVKAPGVTYDGANHPVTVTVSVTDVNGLLKVDASVRNENIVFENTYNAKSAEVIFNGTKTFDGASLADHAFTFQLYQTDHLFDITSNHAALLATANNVNGAFHFTSVLTTTGTYFFVIVEDAASSTLENVVYDRTQHKFAVQVSDIGNGQLQATVTNVSTGISSVAAASVCVDVAFVNATFDKAAKKEVYLANTTTEIDGQAVKDGDVLTYFITYTNYTGEDVVVDIMDTISAHTTYVKNTASHNGTYAGTHLSWRIHVAKGSSVTVSFDVSVAVEATTISNTAVIRDGVNTYTTNTVYNPVEKPVDPSTPPPKAGDTILLTLWIALATVCGIGTTAVAVSAKKKSEEE